MNASLSFFATLWRVVILSVCSTLIVSIAFGCVFLISEFPDFGSVRLGWLYMFGVGFVSSLSVGGIIGLAYAVPLYTLYLRTDAFTFWILALLAVAPGLIMLPIEIALGVFLLFGGGASVLLMHELDTRWFGLRARQRQDKRPEE